MPTRPLLECRSTGYLYEDSDQRTVLLQSMSDAENVAEAIVIPKSCVRRVTTLRAAEPV
jgi:hypothetical protein